MFRIVVGWIACIGIVASIEDAAGADRVTSSWYGSGVHRYFAGDYAAAHEALSRAIDAGTQDPRCYYFRAMADLKLGREEEALTDMKAGAKLETQDSDRFYPVNRSLERVQGRERLMLQRVRREARTEAYENENDRNVRRYEQLRHNERDVLRRRVTVPLESLTPSGDLAEVVEETPTEETTTAGEPVTMPEISDAPSNETAPTEAAPEVGKKMPASVLAKVLFRISGGEGALDLGRSVQRSAVKMTDAARKATEPMRGGDEDSPFDDEPFEDGPFEDGPFNDGPSEDESDSEDDLFGDGPAEEDEPAAEDDPFGDG